MILVATAGATGASLDGLRDKRVAGEARRLADEAGRRVHDAIAVQAERLLLEANGAGSNPLLLSALRGGVDAGTLRDIFTSEDWWAPYRDASAAISYEGTKLAFSQETEDANAALSALVADVRARGEGLARTVAVEDRVLTAAAAPIPLSDGARAVLVLARALEGKRLQEVATRSGAPVVLADARGMLASAGGAQDLALLRTVLGRELEGAALGDDHTWAAVATSIGTGLWAWTGVRVSDFARELAVSDRTKKRALWLLALFAAGGAVAVTWRRRDAAAQVAAPLAEGASQPRQLVMGSPTPGTGTPLGRYVLLDRIGEGGMAEVFTAVSFGAGGFRRFFVVKRLRAELVGNAAAVAHFVDEANLASSLVHPNIVPVFDFGEADGTYYLAQEYVVGRDLGQLRRRIADRGGPAPSTAAVLYVAHELLAALEYAHDKRDDDGTPLELVHRDVTPANVLVSARGEVKLVDFGIVKSTTPGRVATTEIGHVKGNVDFMAPEQARGRAVDRRADLFSVGLVTFFAAAGRPLYSGDTTYDRLIRAATGLTGEDWERVRALPAPLPALLERALAYDPAERFQSAGDFRAAVAAHVEGGAEELAVAVDKHFARELQVEQERLTTAFPRTRTRDVPATAESKAD